jgi:hypothetical protein
LSDCVYAFLNGCKQYYSGDENKAGDTGEHLVYMENRNAHRVLWENPKARDHF